VWPRHDGHSAAHAWFAEEGSKAWASNALTQLGTLRLLTHPAVTKGVVSAIEAAQIVRALTAHEGHQLWPMEEIGMADWGALAERIHGRRQWTASRLLVEVVRRDGGLVTFDAGMKTLAGERLGERVRVLGQRTSD
jgi:predicted nucleic acid-binding protein